ncbi:hypothetical protein HN51_055834 [Arachis hypogaea]|uniref:NAC domain-containing protein n=1 Tax=Arachis hypogaea TaxID=3818 RepID=A0A444XRM0_ARAHY|nr:NAC domain-containing protein 53 [Arachis ipaensis]XP_025674692.1 NAC domain-containing protein 53 [Arachis hypogaea]QHN78615.1 NAC domain-containing protein [Arachis hypogaea]RYQ92352.1 hypothetical protein Ahy_B09g098554 [Arachis hypogaea]
MSRILGPGFRFHPTDDELVQYYLRRKVIGKLNHHDHIGVINIYDYEPWQLPELSKLNTRDLEWYFFTVLDKKYEKGEKTKRATVNGYWKTTGKDRGIKYGDRQVGMKKTLVYHEGRAPTGKRSNWVMHEYRMVDEQLAEVGYQLDAFVLCRIFEKSGMGPKNGEKYGAPFREEDWVEDGDLLEPIADEPVVELSVDQSDAFLETDDLEKKLGTHVVDGSADLPPNPPNYFYGECSHYPQHQEEFVEVPKPLEGTEGRNFDVTGPYAEDTCLENHEMNHNGNSSGFIYGDVNSDEIMDSIVDPLIGAELFLETDDLLNPIEGNSSGADPYTVEGNHPRADPYAAEGNPPGPDPYTAEGNYPGTDPYAVDMLDEYLALPDDDILRYISFDDSPPSMEGENPILEQIPPLIQQNVEEEAKDVSEEKQQKVEGEATNIFKTNKHDLEANSSRGGSASDDANPIAKRFKKWLEDIPAAPAFAAELPSKKDALQLHSAPQSSNTTHVTAGMVSITNITGRGNDMNPMVAKIGGGFNHPIISAVVLIPVSGLLCGKTLFVLTYGWAFLVTFSFLFATVTCKIGTFMYSGK